MNTACVNEVICDSIPIDKRLKRFLINRYRNLLEKNGPKYAADVFKHISETCLRYRADPDRIENSVTYLRDIPISRKGWVREILHYMDCQPMYMLNFLKLYVGMAQPLVTVEEAARAHTDYLESRNSEIDSHVPGILKTWLEFVLEPMWSPETAEIKTILEPDDYMSRLYSRHDYSELREYWGKWHSRLLYFKDIPDAEAMRSVTQRRTPVPEVYKDFEYSTHTSQTLDEDYWIFSNILNGVGSYLGPAVSERSVNFLKKLNSSHPDAFNLWDETDPEHQGPWLPETIDDLPSPAESTVGRCHHIPKKGTVKRRTIAVPNRFLQQGLLPFQMELERIIRRLPRDCTFNQSKFDVKIANRVTNPNLYVGSVDLHQATDNLPANWGWAIWDAIVDKRSRLGKPISRLILDSAHLFHDVSSGYWMNEGEPVQWDVGQPLGSLPSFDFLALTHNCLLEAISVSRGLLHSPYCILGDDLLVFNKKLRKHYIQLLTNAGIPLSLQKSYQGNLVEFAGKIFIRNQLPAYRSDQTPIGFHSLFDYQRSTGIRVPWEKLPKDLKRKFHRAVAALDTGASDEKVYWLIQINLVNPDPTELSQFSDLSANFCLALTDKEEEPPPLPLEGSGVVALKSGHPITLGDFGYADKDGHLQRFRKISLPEWYVDKVRPYTTEALISSSVSAFKTMNDRSSQGV